VQLKRTVPSARAQGVDVELISANEAGGLWPLMETKDLVYNLFNLGRHLISAKHYRSRRMSAFASWKAAVA
jgi:glycine/D-amino acid oxidase-like deaminating enzyme